MHKALIAVLSVAAATLALPAHAVDNGIYLGGSVGQSGVHDDGVEGTSFDANATAYKLIAGWRILDWLAVEGDYIDFGSGNDKIDGAKVETDINGVSLSAIGFLPLGPVDVFARVGAINYNADLKAPAFDIKASDDGTDFTYGIGAQFRIWSLSFRAEYERFEVSDIDTVDLATLGVTWTFL
jgi:hypothetical protein